MSGRERISLISPRTMVTWSGVPQIETARSPMPGGFSSFTLTRAPLLSRISRIDEPPGPISLPARCVATRCSCVGIDVSGGRRAGATPPLAFTDCENLARIWMMSSTATCTRSSGPMIEMGRSTASSDVASSTLTIALDLLRMPSITEPPLPMMDPHARAETSKRTLKDMTVSPWSFSAVQTSGLEPQAFCISASSKPMAELTPSVEPPSCTKRARFAPPGKGSLIRQPELVRIAVSAAPLCARSAERASLCSESFRLTSTVSKSGSAPLALGGPSMSATLLLRRASIAAADVDAPALSNEPVGGPHMAPPPTPICVPAAGPMSHLEPGRAGAAPSVPPVSHFDVSERTAACAAWSASQRIDLDE
mmetsp:Transcript_29072/g.68032  ORF Transcript_29072/g.68032 Transcript_29072/m.68032 type:complete len:365 (+) Transcript_29072:1301-2395(+)